MDRVISIYTNQNCVCLGVWWSINISKICKLHI